MELNHSYTTHAWTTISISLCRLCRLFIIIFFGHSDIVGWLVFFPLLPLLCFICFVILRINCLWHCRLFRLMANKSNREWIDRNEMRRGRRLINEKYRVYSPWVHSLRAWLRTPTTIQSTQVSIVHCYCANGQFWQTRFRCTKYK